jgi:membrane associated rhomboid family serine protease
VIPLKDKNPSSGVPFFVILLILANGYGFYHMVTLGPQLAEKFVDATALIPARDFVSIMQAPSLLAWVSPFFASMFLHGGLLHIFFNMWTLWIFGDNVESVLGHVRFFLFYIFCGLAAAIVHCAMHPASAIPVVGASGAISGVMGAYMVLFPHARLKMFTLLVIYPLFFEMPAFVFMIIWFLGQLMSANQAIQLQQAQGVAEAGGIAFMAHIGGFVAGILGLLVFRPRKMKR